MKTALTFDIGGTKIASALVREDGTIIKSSTTSTKTGRGPEVFIGDIISAGEKLAENIQVDCIGISSAGPLDPNNGQLINPTNLKTENRSWGLVDITAPIQNHFKKPTVMENDAAAAVVGELWQGGHGKKKSLLAITLGTGVGIGAVVEGRLQRCRDGFHPEVSHMTINGFDALAVCGCGNLGCIEAYLSGRNFPIYYSKKTGGRPMSGKEFVELANKSDSYAIEGFNHYSSLMAQSLHSLILTYSPEAIVFAGSFSESFPFFSDKTERLLEEMLKERREGLDFLPELKHSMIAEKAGLLGAAKMAFQFPDRL